MLDTGAKVSVIIPTHNRAAFLKEAVESVLQQSYSNLEVLVIDDGSTEDQEKFLGGFVGAYRLIRQEQKGVSSARNRGIHESSGEYMAFLDSDDLWDKRKIQRQVERMESLPDIFLGHTDEIWIRKGVRVNPMKKHQKSGGSIFSKCIPLCMISPSSVIVRRELFERVGLFDESLPACEDYDLWLRVGKDHLVDYIDEKLTIKRGGHPDQLSRKFWGMDRFRVRALANLLKEGGLSPEQREEALSAYKEKCFILSKGSKKRGHEERSLRYDEIAAAYFDF
jgi:glycosyltransferase involved in cell wall biosynthesis